MKICTLSSGSKGNATFVHDGTKALLVDNGLTLAMLKDRLEARDLDISDIKAILVTHEHIDHIKGVATVARALKVPVYAPEACIDAIIAKSGKRSIDIHPISECGNDIAGLEVEAFRVPHDAIYTVGYTICDGDSKVGIATDLGTVNESIFSHLASCNTVLLEANHDREMLLSGSYPFALKKRIDSVNGHLSNEHSAKTIVRLFERGVNKFILGHLSEDNNSPEIAFDRVATEFEDKRLIMGADYTLDVAMQRTAGKIITVK